MGSSGQYDQFGARHCFLTPRVSGGCAPFGAAHCQVISPAGTEGLHSERTALAGTLRVLMPFAGTGVGGSVVSRAEMMRHLRKHGGEETIVMSTGHWYRDPIFD